MKPRRSCRDPCSPSRARGNRQSSVLHCPPARGVAWLIGLVHQCSAARLRRAGSAVSVGRGVPAFGDARGGWPTPAYSDTLARSLVPKPGDEPRDGRHAIQPWSRRCTPVSSMRCLAGDEEDEHERHGHRQFDWRRDRRPPCGVGHHRRSGCPGLDLRARHRLPWQRRPLRRRRNARAARPVRWCRAP